MENVNVMKSGNITASYIRLGHWMNGVLYIPSGEQKPVGVVILHSDADYLNFIGGENLAKRGFLTLCANVEHASDPLEKKLPSVKLAIETMKKQPGIEKVVILGHSGGATLMSCYQAVAENGAEIFRDENRIVKMGEVPPLTAADGIMLIDSNFGNGVMTLASLEPGILDETSGVAVDKKYAGGSPENGFRENGETHYSEEFKEMFYAAQAARQERLINFAKERLAALEQHRGRFFDDEPMLVPGGSQIAPCNKLFPADLGMLAHTKREYDLLHGDGSVTHQVIPSVRTARGGMDPTPVFGFGAMNTTVKTYLSSNCVRTTADYCVTEDGITGIDYDSAFCCTPGNVKYIHAPMLIMGMTAGYEFMASEVIYENAASTEKTIAFVEGATHMLTTAKDAEKVPGQFGDATAVLFDYAAKWLDASF